MPEDAAVTTTDAPVDAPVADDTSITDDLDAIAAEPETPTDPWAIPEGDSFDRETVERFVTQGRELHERWNGIDHEQATNGLHLMEALSTPEGVREFFVEAGEALGIDQKQVYALLSGQPVGVAPAPQAPEEDEDLDQVMTKREFLEALQKQVLEPQQQQLAAQQEAQRVAVAQQAVTHVVDNELKLGGDENKAERDVVLAIADGLVAPDERDPQKMAAAVRQAHAQFKEMQQKTMQAYIAQKRQQTQSVPKTLGSNTGGAADGAVEAPKSLAEAIQRRKEGKLGI